MAKLREKKSREAEDAEEALEDAEREAAAAIEAAQEKVRLARAKARRLRRELRFAETNEGDAYGRELASIEEVERLEGSAPPVVPEPSLDDLLANGDLVDFPLDEGIDLDALQASPFAWGQVTGSSFPDDFVGGTAVEAGGSS